MAEAERYQHYEVLRHDDGSLWELGRGAMGITYKAFDTNLRCPVALKVINNTYLNSDIARQRFLREARAAAALRHQNVASVFHLGTDHESYFYAMEFIDGETVDAYMKRIGPLAPVQALEITLQVSRALAAAVKQQLVHRDLKPANLMLVDEEGEKVVKVIDFGLAKSAKREGEDSGALTVGGGFVGTPHFASPEQLEERDIDIRSDIYSLGATLYYMISGRPPYSGSVAQIMSQHLYKPLPLEPLEGSPSCVVQLVNRMMEKDRANRPQSPGDLRQEIIRCVESIQASATATDRASGEMQRLAEPPETLATEAFSTDRPPGSEPSTILARRYRITQDLGESTQGRRFLADDLQRGRRVSILVFNREFLSDSKRYTALEQEVDRLRRAPRPELQEIYSLESTGQESFLVQEIVIGPRLVEILRARSALPLAEALLLLKLLAPVADHARVNRLQQVDLTISGVHLTTPGLTEAAITPGLLQTPLIQWNDLSIKVEPVDFSLSADESATWAGSATLVQGSASQGPRASDLGMLSLLIYELLGGPRKTVEATGRYTPISVLSEEGNSILRRGLTDELATAVELSNLLEGELFGRGTEHSFVSSAAPVQASTRSGVGSSSGSATTQPPPPPETYVPPAAPEPPPPSVVPPALPPDSSKRKTSMAGLLLVFGLVVILLGGLGVGGFAVYQYFVGQQLADSRKSHPTPFLNPSPRELATPTPTPTPRPTPTPTPRPTPTPTPRPTPTPTPRPTPTPTPRPTPTPTPTPEEPPTPAPTPEEKASPLPTPEEKATPSPTPEQRVEPTPEQRPEPTPSQVPLDDFQEKLGAAQELSKSGDWQAALKAYLGLIDRFPERSIAMKRLENLLAGVHSTEGKPEPAEYAESKADLVRAAEKGVVPAMLMIGQFSRENNPPEAMKWFEIAAAKGSAPAMIESGLLYSNRREPGDDRKALEFFLQASNTGDRVGKYLAGECYYYGKGVPVDVPKAVGFLQEAAGLREPRAMDLLGTHYRKVRQFDQARKYYEDAAAEGYTLSLSNLGVLYMNGEGVQRSPEIAANLFKQGAEKGDANGMFFYAGCLAEGLGLQRDTKGAAEWFRRSARAGNPRAVEWCRVNGVPYK
jgi:serine/threonine protein kinase/TPR repeat protein